jgi:hypothetical protein
VVTDEEIGRAIRLDQCIAWEPPEEIQKKYAIHPFTMGEPNSGVGPISRKLLLED